jgi:hypothetical protein
MCKCKFVYAPEWSKPHTVPFCMKLKIFVEPCYQILSKSDEIHGKYRKKFASQSSVWLSLH